MKPRSLIEFTLALVLAFALAGCIDRFNADTILHPDGSVERAISQPAKFTPEAVQQASFWNHAESASGSPEFNRTKEPVELFTLDEEGKRARKETFTAWARFESVDDIPEHAVFKSADGSLSAGLSRLYERNPYVFVNEYLWEETLTNVISLTDRDSAIEEQAQLWISLASGIAVEYLGPGTDVSQLEAWGHKEGIAWLREIQNLQFDRQARESRRVLDLEADDEEDHEQQIAEINRRYGLNLLDENGEMLSGTDQEAAQNKFLIEKILTLVKGPDGNPPSRKKIQSALAGTEFVLSGEDAESEEGEEAPPLPPDVRRFKEAADKVVTQQFGDAEGLLKAWEKTEEHVSGLGGSREFDYRMKVPGLIVETTGQLLEDDLTVWKFDASRSFPYGYPMAVRSLVAVPAIQSKLLGKTPVTTRKEMLAYVSFMKRHQDLLQVVRDCAREKNLEPLRAHEGTIAGIEDKKERKSARESLERLAALLQIEL